MGKQSAVAIVGAGFSGLLTAIHIMRQSADGGPRIYLIEKQSGFGAGKAYSTGNPSHRLNTRVGNMSAFPDAPHHFLEWAARNAEFCNVDGQSFVSRKTYGEYLQFLLRQASTGADAAGRLFLVPDEAVGIERFADGFKLHLGVGKTLAVDAAVIATGNPPPHPPPIRNQAFFDSGCYVGDPWSSDWLERLHRQESVLLLGTGLTMIDVLLSLHDHGHKGAIHALSRRGLLPRTHKESAMPGATPPPLPPKLSEALRAVRHRVRAAAAHGMDWRDVMDALRPVTRPYWQSLDLEAKKRFLRHLRPWWDVHRHRLAPDVAARLERLRSAAFFRLLRGRIEDIALPSARDGRAVVHWRPHGKTDAETLPVDVVVNCMGPGGNPQASPSPLIRSLLRSGMARPDALKLGLDVDATGALKNAEGKACRKLFAIGPPTRGSFWEITAVPDIRVQAQETAKSVLLCLKERSQPVYVAAQPPH